MGTEGAGGLCVTVWELSQQNAGDLERVAATIMDDRQSEMRAGCSRMSPEELFDIRPQFGN
jgi:hypothetical protein